MRRLVCLVGLVLAMGGCAGGTASEEEGVCGVALFWRGEVYDGFDVAPKPPLGESLGEARIACDGTGEGEPTKIAAIQGADPSIVVAALPPNLNSGDRVTVWVRRGTAEAELDESTIDTLWTDGPDRDGSPEHPSAQPPVVNCDLPAAKPARGVVLVYLTKTKLVGGSPTDRRNYVAVARPLSDDEAIAPLRAALRELLEGRTPAERHLGCGSIFDGHQRVLRRVELVDGEAVVDFHGQAFLDELGMVSASHAGTVFSLQMQMTVFQFPQVRSLRYELEGSCKAFGDFVQAAKCIVVRERP